MSERVTIALLGNPAHAFDNNAFTWHEHGATELDQPGDALPRVTLTVEPHETIFEVLKRALHESGIRLPDYVNPDDPPLAWVLFYVEGVQPSWQRFLGEPILTDEDGRARWGVPYESVTYEQLLRSSEGGTIPVILAAFT